MIGGELTNRIDSVADGAQVSGVMLDGSGKIVEVSSGWRASADRLGLNLPNYGIGQNYLQYCLSTDDESLEIYRGLRRVLKRKAPFFSSLYSCSVDDSKQWKLLVASPYGRAEALTTILHIDLSGILGTQEIPRVEIGPSAADINVLSDVLVKAVQGSIADALADRRDVRAYTAPPSAESKALASLTARQRVILKHMAGGLSNAEIAAAMNISLSSAKALTASVIRKLNFRNRTQAALFAARAGLE